MIPDYAIAAGPAQVDTVVAQRLHRQRTAFLAPRLDQLDRQRDVRLVRTFLATISAILTFRQRAHGLLLSELGA